VDSLRLLAAHLSQAATPDALRARRVRHASRHPAPPPPCIEYEFHCPKLQDARRDSIHRPFEMRGDLRIRSVGEESEGVQNLLLLRAEVLGGFGGFDDISQVVFFGVFGEVKRGSGAELPFCAELDERAFLRPIVIEVC
jgi:hypothetical protein